LPSEDLATTVLGIDPGTQVVGFGILAVGRRTMRFVDAGVLRANRRDTVPERLGEIGRQLDGLLGRVRPDVVVVEDAFASRNLKSALRLGEARGVVLAGAARHAARLVQMPPAVCKKALVGNGSAAKEQVAAMVCRLLRIERAPDPLDATDALALALAHVMRESAQPIG